MSVLPIDISDPYWQGVINTLYVLGVIGTAVGFIRAVIWGIRQYCEVKKRTL